jgi:uncharacterized Zn-binding protein involved in type VI secretion
MGQPVARQGDSVTATDTHILLMPSPGGPVPTPTPLPFAGTLTGGLSTDVLANGMPVAVQGSTATNVPPHLPIPPGTFSKPPANQGQVVAGSVMVLANGKPLARLGDQVLTCNDPVDLPVGTITTGSADVLAG